MVSDSKKIQTMINVASEQIEIIRSAVSVLKATRDTFNVINPNTAGTVLQGNKNAVSSSIDAIDIESSLSVWDELINAKVLSHKNKALN